MATTPSSEGGLRREGGTEGDQSAGRPLPSSRPPCDGSAAARDPLATISDDLRTRFLADLGALSFPADARLAVAVSGGADSLALLLLAAATLPGRIEAATVDHGFRPEARAEAAMVGVICHRLAVPLAVLSATSIVGPAAPGGARGSLQMRARALRYQLLTRWAGQRGIGWLATAHQLDDQAETVLLRAARGSGVTGLGGVRPARREGAARLVRPLLGWRRGELAALVSAAGLDPVDDPANRDPRHDRTRARRLLAEVPWLDSARLAATAAHARDAADALDWMTDRLWGERATADAAGITITAEGLPRELGRRLLARAVAELQPASAAPVRPERIAALVDRLARGESGTIGTVQAVAGRLWRITRAPPRRSPIG